MVENQLLPTNQGIGTENVNAMDIISISYLDEYKDVEKKVPNMIFFFLKF